MSKKLILGSTSGYRADALQTLGLEFSQISPLVDETPFVDELADALALRLALAKAKKVAKSNPGDVVIGSDQTGSCNNKLLTKPGSIKSAIAALTSCSGKYAVFYSAIALYQHNLEYEDQYLTGVTVTELKFRNLSEREITKYVDADMPLDCAGSFKAESLGIALFESIRSEDPSALMGLPLIQLISCLKQFEVNIL
jgi:septum formation protein